MRKLSFVFAVLATLGGASLATSASAAPGAPLGVAAPDADHPCLHDPDGAPHDAPAHGAPHDAPSHGAPHDAPRDASGHAPRHVIGRHLSATRPQRKRGPSRDPFFFGLVPGAALSSSTEPPCPSPPPWRGLGLDLGLDLGRLHDRRRDLARRMSRRVGVFTAWTGAGSAGPAGRPRPPGSRARAAAAPCRTGCRRPCRKRRDHRPHPPPSRGPGSGFRAR